MSKPPPAGAARGTAGFSSLPSQRAACVVCSRPVDGEHLPLTRSRRCYSLNGFFSRAPFGA
jgi:hypothetical protein